MWTTLTLVVLAATAPTPPEGIALGSRVRLSAGPRVDAPRLFSGTAETHSARPYEEKRGLLVFRAADGSPEAVIAPGARVEGTLVDADPVWLHVQRSKEGPADRIVRASVARVKVLAGRKRASGKGAAVGLGVGAALGAGFFMAMTGPEGSDEPFSLTGLAVTTGVLGAGGAGVGALLGLAWTDDEWREIPLDALPGRPIAVAQSPSGDPAPIRYPAEPGPFRRAIAELSAAGPGR